MREIVLVAKNEEDELPVPTEWRSTFVNVVNALRHNNFVLEGMANVSPLSAKEAERLSGNIASYGAQLSDLPEETWSTSVYLWMEGYWDVLVDLFTLEEGRSDLVLFARAYEIAGSYRFEIQSIHVP